MIVEYIINKWFDILDTEYWYWDDEILSRFEDKEKRKVAERILAIVGDLLCEIIEAWESYWEIGKFETNNFEDLEKELNAYMSKNIDLINNCVDLQWLIVNVNRDLRAYLIIKTFLDCWLDETSFCKKSIFFIKICYHYVKYIIMFRFAMIKSTFFSKRK